MVCKPGMKRAGSSPLINEQRNMPSSRTDGPVTPVLFPDQQTGELCLLLRPMAGEPFYVSFPEGINLFLPRTTMSQNSNFAGSREYTFASIVSS